MTLVTFMVSGFAAGGFGMVGTSVCLLGLRKGRAVLGELASQVERLRRSIAVLESQSPRPAIGRREMQLIARISTLLPQ